MKRSHSSAIVLTALVVIAGVVEPASGQLGALQQRLGKTTSLSCTFSTLATGTWKEGAPGVDVAAATLKVAFSSVNIDEGTADADGALGSSFIVVRHSNDYLHLMQMHGAGPLHTTTVIARETKDGRLMAVHTRHEYTDVRLPGFTSRPEMYLGDCTLGS
jgi:hypothetical protein